MMRLAIVASHPIQYQAPLFRELARLLDLMVFFGHRSTPEDQAAAGFGVGFEWDVDLLSGYQHRFLDNMAKPAGLGRFAGVDTPEVGDRLREGRFDAVLTMGWSFKCFFQTILAAKHLGIPVLVRGDSHLDTPRSRLKRVGKTFVYPPFLRLFDAALYVGCRSRQYYEHYRYPSERLFFSPHCVDTRWFEQRADSNAGERLRSRLGIAAQEKVVLFAGKLLPFKRPLDVIDACAGLKTDAIRAHLLIAGSGELERTMRDRAEAARVPLHLLGFQNQTDMPAVYTAADLLVLPSDGRETWGLVANEALACGCPIVVSDACGCAADLAADGRAGRVFPVSDMGALTRVLALVLESPPTLGDIVEKSRAYSVAAAAAGVYDAVACSTRR